MDLWQDSGDDVDARRLDAVLAVTLLFAVVIVPPLIGVRTTYTLCWLLFTVLALVSASEAARGIATSMGITVMVGWYALRVYDRSAFTAALHGWVGLWATSPVVGFVARVGDFLVHLLLPMLLISCFLPLVRVWMSLPALMYVAKTALWLEEGLCRDVFRNIGRLGCGCISSWAVGSCQKGTTFFASARRGRSIFGTLRTASNCFSIRVSRSFAS
jgi:hypothetical protein